MAVVLTDGPGGSKRMCVGAGMAGVVFVDVLGGRDEQITMPENGTADFPTGGGSVSVWVPEDYQEQQHVAEKVGHTGVPKDMPEKADIGIGQEVYSIFFIRDNVANLIHIVGGICGIGLGLQLRGKNAL